MNYSTGCAFNLDEVFYNFDRKKLKFNYKQCKKLINSNDKNELIKRIFLDNVEMVLDDIIDNNVTFELPTGSGRRTLLRMKRYDDEQFKKLRRREKFADVDFLSSNFAGYQIGLDMYYKDGRPSLSKPVYVDKKRKEKITENTNNGKQYF